MVENGALLYDPARRVERPLADPIDRRFVAALRERQVDPIEVGHSIVATWQPHQQTVLEAIQSLGLELQVSFNKGSVMVLPAGVTKASGLAAALDDLGLSAHNAVGVGDAENDHAFLSVCEAAVAVANALPLLKDRADLVTTGSRGDGVIELVGRLLEDDLASLEPALARHAIVLGERVGDSGAPAAGEPTGGERSEGDRGVEIQPYGRSLLVAGPSGSGKSTLISGILDRLGAAGYQFCIVDPEGDYQEVGKALVLGGPKRPASADEAFGVLRRPERSVILNLLGIPIDDRPGFCQALMPRIEELRGTTAAPTGSSSTRPTTCSHRRGSRRSPTCRAPSRRRSWSPFIPIASPRPRSRRSTPSSRLAMLRQRRWRATSGASGRCGPASRSPRACPIVPSRARPSPGVSRARPTHGRRMSSGCALGGRARPASPEVRGRRAAGGAELLLPGPPRTAEPQGAEPRASSCRSPTASTTTPGSSTSSGATSRAGCER